MSIHRVRRRPSFRYATLSEALQHGKSSESPCGIQSVEYIVDASSGQFDFMDMISLEGNFFENRVPEYRLAKVGYGNSQSDTSMLYQVFFFTCLITCR